MKDDYKARSLAVLISPSVKLSSEHDTKTDGHLRLLDYLLRCMRESAGRRAIIFNEEDSSLL